MARTSRTPGRSQRQLRLGEQIRHELASLLRRGDFRDPALADANVTVTEVRVSPDLRNATAFVMTLGGGALEDTVRALNRAAPFVRGQLARVLDLRHAPQVGFEPDRSFDSAARIERLLRDERVARDLGADAPDADTEEDEPEDGAPAPDAVGPRDGA